MCILSDRREAFPLEAVAFQALGPLPPPIASSSEPYAQL